MSPPINLKRRFATEAVTTTAPPPPAKPGPSKPPSKPGKPPKSPQKPGPSKPAAAKPPPKPAEPKEPPVPKPPKARWLRKQAAELEALPPAPARIRLNGRTRAVSVPINTGELSSPFRIRDIDKEKPLEACEVIWGQKVGDVLTEAPSGFVPISCGTRREAQELIQVLFREWLLNPAQAELLAKVRENLRGKYLSCKCAASTPCHGDTLLELANADS